jgi:hypothetical protein
MPVVARSMLNGEFKFLSFNTLSHRTKEYDAKNIVKTGKKNQ